MSILDWTAFERLPGSKSRNLENLCRGLVRLHFEKCGLFAALRNQPGVEFHLRLCENNPVLGAPPRWYGWQCKFHELTAKGDLKASSREDIEDSLIKAARYLPGLTDWVLWTPYTLTKSDQDWLWSVKTRFRLHLWAEEEIETYLSGPGVMLRSAYFGELALTPESLDARRLESVQVIRDRWLEPVHQSVNAERLIRRMLGEPMSWNQMIAIGERLKQASEAFVSYPGVADGKVSDALAPFIKACDALSDTLLFFHDMLSEGDLDIIQQKLSERKSLLDRQVRSAPRRLRALSLPIALEATNSLADLEKAQELLDEIEEYLGVGLVAVLADAGAGKTQLAAQLTLGNTKRPAGILFHGRYLQKGQTLNDLAHHYLVGGNPVESMEKLLAAIDAAGKRSGCRLPLVVDGLNEAEDPRDWKDALAVLTETLRKYPNVLFICTLRTGERRRDEPQYQASERESFAVMALPEGLRKIECEGFGGDVDSAVQKYFEYFKINPGDAEIPIELLQHPLTLRIFCEVTNLRREKEVKIDYFPASLSPLFEKYIANACMRISQMKGLRYLYSISEVETAIYKLGLEMWANKRREIREAEFRPNVSDGGRSWDCSIVNLFAQEGIVFRNPGLAPGEYTLTAVYDALGGYIIANALLQQHAYERSFEWLSDETVASRFGGETSHELAFDIFKALVALTPRRRGGMQLWKEAPASFRSSALRLSTELEGKYLDEETVAALLDLVTKNTNVRQRMFSRLRETRGAVDHPLNSAFLDSALRKISTAERDLSWTEWIRATRNERLHDLVAMERRWMSDRSSRTKSDRLRAIWSMWLLTSSDHELRDLATRVLYWFGRADPSSLFEECLRSLDINDPYVPERMLAASYGVAMALHVDLADPTFSRTSLPEYARRLYSSVFEKGSPSGTTHALIREYATRTIELASVHNPGLFSKDEIARSNPPFADGGIRDWGESDSSNADRHAKDSPFRMDFENYTIGSLVPRRRNYDYTHKSYTKVRAQILWRVEQLGWSGEAFKEVDRSIESGQNWPRTGSESKKTDRYGKKYSWIAFYEMSGLLSDRGELETWRERSSRVDIDPSYPVPVTKAFIVQANFLEPETSDLEDWIANSPIPDVNPYLRMEAVQGIKGPWIALDGFFGQEDKNRRRRIFCFIRSFMIKEDIADSFFHHLRSQDLGGRWLPEKPEVIFTFAGEIPWSEAFPANGPSEFEFEVGEERVVVAKPHFECYLDGVRLEWTPAEITMHRLLGRARGKSEEPRVAKEDFDRIEIREVLQEVEEVRKEFRSFTALIPVCDLRWEASQSVGGDVGNACTLAKEIAAQLGLIGQPQTFDLFSADGVQMTVNVSDHSDDFITHQSMFFIRESALLDYLRQNSLVLIWAWWGEREPSLEEFGSKAEPPSPDVTRKVFSEVKLFEPKIK